MFVHELELQIIDDLENDAKEAHYIHQNVDFLKKRATFHAQRILPLLFLLFRILSFFLIPFQQQTIFLLNFLRLLLLLSLLNNLTQQNLLPPLPFIVFSFLFGFPARKKD